MAVATGRTFMVQCSADGKQVRVVPDESDQTVQPDDGSPPIIVSGGTELPAGVVLTPKTTSTIASAADGWTTLVAFQADGTSPESAEVVVGEPDRPEEPTITVRVRGMTGVVTANSTNAAPAGGRP